MIGQFGRAAGSIRAFLWSSGCRRWWALLVSSLLVAAALEWIGIPAAPMLGPMLAAIVLQGTGRGVRVPDGASVVAQAVIGCLIARTVTPSFAREFATYWHVLVGAVALSLAASVALGWAMSR